MTKRPFLEFDDMLICMDSICMIKCCEHEIHLLTSMPAPANCVKITCCEPKRDDFFPTNSCKGGGYKPSNWNPEECVVLKCDRKRFEECEKWIKECCDIKRC